MKNIVVNDSNRILISRENNLVVTDREGQVISEIAINNIESISLYGSPSVSTVLIKRLAINKIPIHYFNKSGKYITSTYIPYRENYEKQKVQFVAIQDESFCLEIAKKIISSKITFQKNLVMAYDKDHLFNQLEYTRYETYIEKISESINIKQILGFEGKSAKSYFYQLGLLVEDDYKFNRRSKRPPLDPFNALISLGYSILHSYIKGQLVRYGLNLGFGVIHENKTFHAALASDLIEVWRPIIIDEVTMRLARDRVIPVNGFYYNETGGCFVSKEYRNIFISSLRKRMKEQHFYFLEHPKKFTANYAIDLQIESLQRAFRKQDPKQFLTISGRSN